MKALLLALSAVLLAALPARADMAAQAPAGWIMFCTNNPSFCEAHAPVGAAPSMLPVISAANSAINQSIAPAPLDTDDDRRAETRNWRVVLTGGEGVCVEYALDKLFVLAALHVPLGAMRLAQVHRRGDGDGDFHMVLLVNIGGHQYVLDSLTPEIKTPEQTNYEWVAVETASQDKWWHWVKPDGAPK